MVALVVSLALALGPYGAASVSHGANFPVRGVVVPGKSIGGIRLGESEAAVKAAWGTHFVNYCPTCAMPTWLYEYRGGEPLGAAVKFQNSRVVAVFTLGSPIGWGVKGVMMGDPLANVYNLFANTGQANCIGYNALTVRLNGSTTSFYSASGVIYGYALTAASQSPCQ